MGGWAKTGCPGKPIDTWTSGRACAADAAPSAAAASHGDSDESRREGALHDEGSWSCDGAILHARP